MVTELPGGVSLSDPMPLAEARLDALPWNFLSEACAAMIAKGSRPARVLMSLPVAGQTARVAVIPAETLRDPQATAEFILRLDAPGLSEGARLFLGPATGRAPSDGKAAAAGAEQVTGAPWRTLPGRPFDRALVIIDAGIAFWNARFRDAKGPRFRGMRYLDFDAPGLGLSEGLDEDGIASICALADTHGNRAAVARLGVSFPASFFGPAANPDPDGLWHGTAVADLAAGASGTEAEGVALFGIELPRRAIADYSGETLSAMLATLLPAAIDMTAGFAHVPLTIVMPLGFPAGPQDGSHPAAAAMRAALQGHAGRDIRVVLPAGNHLQDRCRARLGTSGASVCWDLPPDDFSTNEVEIFGSAGRPLRLGLASPGRGQVIDASLPLPRSFRHVRRDGVQVGLLMRFDDRDGRSRTRLSLWRTAATDGAASPSGRWTIVNGGTDALDLWLFRDDRDPVADRMRPHRPSRFWSAGYVPRDATGAPPLGDDPGATVLRSGTLSVLATAALPGVDVVQADRRHGGGPVAKAAYSGSPGDGSDVAVSELVDDGWPGRGVAVAANGGQRRVRMSGTSAAAGLRARRLLGIGPAPAV